ncbi:MAG: hypothetical protein ACI9UN_003447 [Granulosicoccus sp.]|jgi:hypothetical protein
MTKKTNLTASADAALAVDSSHFESRKIQTIDSRTLLIKPTIATLAFSLLFVFLGLAVAAVWAVSTMTSFEGPDSIPLLLIGVLFIVAGLGTFYSSNEQLLINNNTGAGFIRSWYPAVSSEKASTYKQLLAQDIVAIQTVSRPVKRRSNRSKRSNSYTEYQVNLCTADDERHNAFITLKSEKADQLGSQLANLFNVPLRAQ